MSLGAQIFDTEFKTYMSGACLTLKLFFYEFVQERSDTCKSRRDIRQSLLALIVIF